MQKNLTNSETSIHHYGFVVSDLDAAMNFYVTHLGFINQSMSSWTPVPGAPLGFGDRTVQLRVGLMRLGPSVIEMLQFDNDPDLREPFEPRPGGGHLAIAVTDIHQMHWTLSKSGVNFYSEPQELDTGDGEPDWWVYGRDPFGTVIELHQTA